MKLGSLFTGIGGLDLGLLNAGLGPIAWQVENDPFCCQVLHRRFGRVPVPTDVYDVEKLPTVDLVCGGFPCQDLSQATRGRGFGLDGNQSGLWFEMRRIVGGMLPSWVIVENVDGAARKWWVPRVRRDLHELGYWSLQLRLKAFEFGAPFEGSRIFVVASTDSERQPASEKHAQVALVQAIAESSRDWGAPPPEALGMADGVPPRLSRQVRAYGNAVMPVMGEAIGRLVLVLRGSRTPA